jgi:hypothetical protein
MVSVDIFVNTTFANNLPPHKNPPLPACHRPISTAQL